jgi:hypothetical protein
MTGRYPFHFHRCGDAPAGTYVKDSSIHRSNFRCVVRLHCPAASPSHLSSFATLPKTKALLSSKNHHALLSSYYVQAVHETHNVLIQGVVAYDHKGHCFFLEDGIETNTVFDRNLALVTRKKEVSGVNGLGNAGLRSDWEVTLPGYASLRAKIRAVYAQKIGVITL